MAVLRLTKLSEVAAAAEASIEEAYADEDVAIGTVLIAYELKSREPDGERGAWVATYCDDSRGWVQRAIVIEAADAVNERQYIHHEPDDD